MQKRFHREPIEHCSEAFYGLSMCYVHDRLLRGVAVKNGPAGSLFDACHILADRKNLPTGNGLRKLEFGSSGIAEVALGRMVAQVTVVPVAGRTRITLTIHGGDEYSIACLKGQIVGSTLKLEGNIPFKTTSRPALIVNHGPFSSASSGSNDAVRIGRREVELAGAIRFVLEVPARMGIKVDDFIGSIGITDRLDARLNFAPTNRAALVASAVKSLDGNLLGLGEITVGSVVGDAVMKIPGGGTFLIGTIGGNMTAEISGMGNVTVRTARGRVTASNRGMGQIIVNGKHCC